MFPYGAGGLYFDAEYLFDRVTDLSLAIYMDAAKLDKLTAHRRKLGLTTTLYTCGAQYSALENQPIESLYTMWYCEKRGADGFCAGRWMPSMPIRCVPVRTACLPPGTFTCSIRTSGTGT